MEKSRKEELKEMAIKNAISNWTDKLNGIYRSHENKRYSLEYCESQIEYFKNLKL